MEEEFNARKFYKFYNVSSDGTWTCPESFGDEKIQPFKQLYDRIASAKFTGRGDVSKVMELYSMFRRKMRTLSLSVASEIGIEVTDIIHTGTGRRTYPDGSVYEGSFVDSKRQGHGHFEMSTGASYTGGYSDDQKHGAGVYRYPDGAVYEGQFENDLLSGHGLKIDISGQIYIGEWSKGYRSGIGALRSPEGTTLACLFGKTARGFESAIGEGVMWSDDGLKAYKAQDGQVLPEQPLTLIEADAVAEQLGATAFLRGIHKHLQVAA